MDFPKVYFFGSLKISLMRIPENPNFAAIFVGYPEMYFLSSRRASRSAPRRAEGPTVPKDRRSFLSQSFVMLSYNRSFVVD